MSENEQLSCRELVELVTEYLDGSMIAEERALFEEHLERCGGCRGYVEQLRSTITVTGRLGAEDVPPEAEAALLEAFVRWKAAG
jgi:predicted anti-sigma-YlaC factor YlaD